MLMNADSDGSGKAVRVLVIDDDSAVRSTISEYLEREHIAVSSASNAREAARQMDGTRFNMVLLDLRLGNEDGLDLLRDLRVKNDIPVIVITGHRRDEVDRIVGLELGADDYMVKPLSLRELLARIRAILRRLAVGRVDIDRSNPPNARFAGWTLDRRTRRLHDPSGTLVDLTKGEFTLLTAFVDAPGRPLTREFLLEATRIHDDVFDRTIDVQILRLRRKIEEDPSVPRMIKTERGHGYTFAVAVEATH